MKPTHFKIHEIQINIDLVDHIDEIEPSDIFSSSDRNVRLSNEFRSLLDDILSRIDLINLDPYDRIDLNIANISCITCDIINKNWKHLLARGAHNKDNTSILLKSRLTDHVRNYIETRYMVSVNISNNRKYYPC